MSQFNNPFESPQNVPAYEGSSQPVSGMGVGSLVCGILSIVLALPGCCCSPIFMLSGMLGLVAVVLGIFGMQECNRGEKSGKGLAVAGLACGGAGLAFSVLLFLLSLFGVLAGFAGQAAQQNRFNPNF